MGLRNVMWHQKKTIQQNFSNQDIVKHCKEKGKYYVMPEKLWTQTVDEARLTGYQPRDKKKVIDARHLRLHHQTE